MFYEGERVRLLWEPDAVYRFKYFLQRGGVYIEREPSKEFPNVKHTETVSEQDIISIEDKLEIEKLAKEMAELRAELEELKKSR